MFKNLLNKVGWSQAKFARETGISQNTVSKMAKDKDTPLYRMAIKYLEALLK